ncbi:unnamed protein product [Microthlaspi erraticum]|uniref:Uncharacterized protein n=1 Tax=Microthlaspi erraticum TaxID=1685480 RepID=A0A6D2IKI0_9BRAS|nr:unnamed protein product [Microthlaspi erraticum]
MSATSPIAYQDRHPLTVNSVSPLVSTHTSGFGSDTNCNAHAAPPGESPCPLSARGPHPCPTVGALFLGGSENVFTIPAIITRPFPVFFPNSHGFAEDFPKGHPSFHYSSPSTLNSGVLYGPLTEKVSAL